MLSVTVTRVDAEDSGGAEGVLAQPEETEVRAACKVSVIGYEFSYNRKNTSSVRNRKKNRKKMSPKRAGERAGTHNAENGLQQQKERIFRFLSE